MFSITAQSEYTKSEKYWIRPLLASTVRRCVLGVMAALLMGVLMLSVIVGNDTGKMPVGDLPGWRQTGFQDFSLPAEYGKVGEVYGSDMRGYAGFPDTSKHGTYAPDSVLSVSEGTLRYFLHEENGQPKVASVVPFGYSGQLYGRYSIRFRYDSLPGYKIAFMLWPTSDRWSDGEIDWPEGQLVGPLYGASAIRGSSVSGTVKFDPPHRSYSPDGPGGWHIATTEWSPGNVKWFWDGVLVSQTEVPFGVPVSPMRWTLQAETADDASATSPNQATAGYIEVDWVVQYAYTP